MSLRIPARVDLGSVRLAFVLIGLIASLLVLSAVIPQSHAGPGAPAAGGHAPDTPGAWAHRLALDRIHRAPYFLALLGLLAVNIVAANTRRFRTIRRVEGTLLRVRHLGSILFHLALVLMLGGILGNALLTFRGVLALTEGQSVSDTTEGYFRMFRGYFGPSPAGRFRARLAAYDPAHPVGDERVGAAELVLEPAGSAEAVRASVYAGHPLSWRGFDFHLGAWEGFSPEVVVLDDRGRTRFRSFVRLATRRTPEGRRYRDFIERPREGLRIEVAVDPAPPGGTDPALELFVDRDGTRLFAGRVTPADTVAAGGYRICLPRLRRWCFVEVQRDPLLDVVFAAFWLALVGLTLSLVPRILRPGRLGT